MSFQDRQLTIRMSGKDVALLQNLLRHSQFGDISEEEFNREYFGETTRNAVVKVQSTYHLNQTGIVDEQTIVALQKIARENKFPTVSGIIITSERIAAPNLRVFAVDKNPKGEDLPLGRAITDVTGNYTILYGDELIKRIGKERADIQIKVTNLRDDSNIFGTSSIHFNAGDYEEISLVLDEDLMEGISEFDAEVGELLLYVKSHSLEDLREMFKDLRENEHEQGISYFANKSGLDARLVAMISLAFQFSFQTQIPPEYYYALFRAGITDPYKTNSQTVTEIWERADRENIIEISSKDKIRDYLKKFEDARKVNLLEKGEPVGLSNLNDLLSISLRDSSHREQFVELYFNHTGDIKNFWKMIEKKFGNGTGERLQLDGKLSYMTANNTMLIRKLYSENIVAKSPADLIKRGFYREESWDDLLRDEIPIPNDIPGKSLGEKKRNYINSILLFLKTSYPSLVVAEMVKNGELSVEANTDEKKEIYEFLQKTSEKFQIGIQPLRKILRENPEIKLSDEALKEIKIIERVYQISPSDRAFRFLKSKNIASAFDVVKYGKQEFIRIFKSGLGGERQAELVYAKSSQIHSTVLSIASSYLTFRNTPRIYAIAGLGEEK